MHERSKRKEAGLLTFKDKYLLTKEDYGPLLVYIEDEFVTDVNWNGSKLWIDHLNEGRFMAEESLSKEFVIRFSSLLANVLSLSFNKMNPVLEAETEELRISIVHQSVAHTGVTISIRKIPCVRRLEQQMMLDSGYCSEAVSIFLRNCIRAHLNIAICGMPGAGKTELLKYLTKYIPSNERVITIEDTLEIHYQKINPDKDCVEMKVAEQFGYTEAIKACLRQLPKWIVLSEARSTEVRYLLESLSTGTYGMTTLHTDDVRNIPDRIKNMAGGSVDSERIINDTYAFVNVGILIKSRQTSENKIVRMIDQIGVFERRGINFYRSINSITMVVENGKLTAKELPVNIVERFREAGIEQPFTDVDEDEWT